MELSILYEWNAETGVSLDSILDLKEQVEAFFLEKNYGASVQEIWIVVNCLGFDTRPRKKFRKKLKRFEFYVYLDFFLIKNVKSVEKKPTIAREIVEKTEEIFAGSKFEDFATSRFLEDWRQAISIASW